MISYTHNGGPVMIDVHPDDRMVYAQLHIKDFLRGVAGLKPDQIGIYMLVLALLYQEMGQLRDDDRWISGHCQCEVRYFRRLKQNLIEAGKIFVADGYIYNNLAMAEIAKFCETMKKKREAALLREQAKREARASGARQAPDRSASGAPQAPHEIASGSTNSEKTNKNNVATTSALPAQSTYKDKEEDKEEDIESDTDRSLQELPLSETVVSDADGDATAKPRNAYSDEFEAFWRDYPDTRGQSKANAFKAWQKLPAASRAAAHLALPEFTRMFRDRQRKQSDLTVLHAQGYLNQRRFETISTTDAKSETSGLWWKNPKLLAACTPDQWRKGIAQYATDRWDTIALGPPPGHPTCVVPHAIVAEMRLTETFDSYGLKRCSSTILPAHVSPPPALGVAR